MKRKLCYLILSLTVTMQWSHAQSGQWEKIPPNVTKGENEQSAVASSKPYKDKDYNYGSETNPSPRSNTVSWSDPKGGLWVFGGSGYDQNYQWGVFRDMWRYDPSANSWKLIKGKTNQAQFAAPQKTESELPLPRKDAASWVDKKGGLWLYGGRSLSDLEHLDDLWRFDPDQGTWSKVKGAEKVNQRPDHGKQNQSGNDSSPGSRSAATAWTDPEGNLWLFGGVSYQSEDNGKASYYNDLWKFDTGTRQWTWIGGSDKANQPTKPRGKNQQTDQIIPSPRTGAAAWMEEKSGELFLYGGYGYDSTGIHQGGLSDLWSYSLKSGTWTLKSNSIKLDAEPEVFTQNSKENTPGFRISAISWVRKPGELYLTGGHNLWGSSQTFIDKRLWKYDVTENIWQPVPIEKTVGIIGSGSSFKDSKGDTYIFGGEEIDPDTNQSRPTNAVWKLTL
jgi:N-acetylneuraminic acid mutarotase